MKVRLNRIYMFTFYIRHIATHIASSFVKLAVMLRRNTYLNSGFKLHILDCFPLIQRLCRPRQPFHIYLTIMHCNRTIFAIDALTTL